MPTQPNQLPVKLTLRHSMQSYSPRLTHNDLHLFGNWFSSDMEVDTEPMCHLQLMVQI